MLQTIFQITAIAEGMEMTMAIIPTIASTESFIVVADPN
jgi:hypothetical protein